MLGPGPAMGTIITMCEQSRSWSDCASAQFDQDLLCSKWKRCNALTSNTANCIRLPECTGCYRSSLEAAADFTYCWPQCLNIALYHSHMPNGFYWHLRKTICWFIVCHLDGRECNCVHCKQNLLLEVTWATRMLLILWRSKVRPRTMSAKSTNQFK